MLSNVSYFAWRDGGRTIDAIGTYSSSTRTVAFDRPTRVPGSTMSPSTFEVLRVSPLLGRWFQESDTQEGATPVVILTTGAGLLVGLTAAAGVSRLLESLLFGVTPLDPASFVLAAVVLGAVALVACALPARRAARVDPLVALRSE